MYGNLKKILSNNRLLMIIIAVMVVMIFFDISFFKITNLINIVSNLSINGILSIGMVLLMISGQFDLSIGSIMVLSGAISIIVVNNFNPESAIIIGIFSGLVLGLINGILVAKFKINSFIATIGTLVIYQGIAYSITNTKPIVTESIAFQKFSALKILNIPIVVFYFLLVIVIVWLVAKFTRLGKYAYAIGGNGEACRDMGIKVDYYIIVYFIISGICASFGGVILSIKLQTASATFGGEDMVLLVIAAIIIGGVHLSGGVGSVGGVVQGIILLGLISNITIYLGLYGNYQILFRSALLLGIVIFDIVYIKYLRRKTQRMIASKLNYSKH